MCAELVDQRAAGGLLGREMYGERSCKMFMVKVMVTARRRSKSELLQIIKKLERSLSIAPWVKDSDYMPPIISMVWNNNTVTVSFEFSEFQSPN